MSKSQLEQARAYLALGWRPLPIPLGQKIPTIPNWQHLDMTHDTAPDYFAGPSNIGVILGDVSGGLVDIDLDSPTAVQLAPLFLPETMTFGRPSKIRSHYLYVARYTRTEKFQGLDGAMLVEIRANKSAGGDEGLQTVFPESVHPSGEIITWDPEWDSPTPLEIKPEELRGRVAHLAAATQLVALGWQIDRAHAWALAPSLDTLVGLEDKGVQRIARWLGLIAPTSRAVTPPTSHTPHLQSRDAVLKRARAYLKRVDPAISGSGGHQTTWGAAIAVVRGFELSEGEAYDVLAEYNARCDPPWSETELRHKITDAMRAERVGHGWLLNDPSRARPQPTRTPPPQTAKSPNFPDSRTAPIDRPVSELRQGEPVEQLKRKLPTRLLATVPDEGPASWLVRDLWLDEGVGIVGGEPKSFKSFVGAQMAVCVASGKPMFGRYEVKRGAVVVFNAEDRPAMTRNRAAKMCRALGVDFATLPIHLIDVPALRLDDVDQMDALAETVADIRPVLVILDPLRDLHASDENDAGAIAQLLAPLRIMQREVRCAVQLVHHMAKLSEINRRAGQRLRGSSALHGWIDSALYLTHKDGAIVVTPEHRAAPAPEPFSFRVEEAETDSGPALWLEPQSDEDEVSEQTRGRENEVIAALRDAAEPLTGRELRTHVSGRPAAMMEIVRRLVSTGVLVEVSITRRGQDVIAFRLANQ